MDEQNTTQEITAQDALVSDVETQVVTEIDKWKALLESAKELAQGEVTTEVTVIEAKIASLEAEAKAKLEALEAEAETEVVAVKQSIYATIATYHNTLNTIGIIVVLLKVFGVI
jgi:hypothetical protein